MSEMMMVTTTTTAVDIDRTHRTLLNDGGLGVLLRLLVLLSHLGWLVGLVESLWKLFGTSREVRKKEKGGVMEGRSCAGFIRSCLSLNCK